MNKKDKDVYKYHAYIQGRNATVYWKSGIEALLWKWLHNLWHNIKRDGHIITNIHKCNYVLITNTDTGQKQKLLYERQKNREKPTSQNRQVWNP